MHVLKRWRGWLWWEFGHLFCVRDTDDIKQKNKNHETILSRFSLNKKQRSLSLTSSLSSTRSFDWNLEFINIRTNCQFIWSGKVPFIWLSVWEFKKLSHPFFSLFVLVTKRAALRWTCSSHDVICSIRIPYSTTIFQRCPLTEKLWRKDSGLQPVGYG